MWESRVLRRAFERLELHEWKHSRAVLRGGGGGDVTSLPDAGVGNHPGLPGPRAPAAFKRSWAISSEGDQQRRQAIDGDAVVDDLELAAPTEWEEVRGEPQLRRP